VARPFGLPTSIVDGKACTVAFPDGAGFDSLYQVAKDPSYPGITEEYRRIIFLGC